MADTNDFEIADHGSIMTFKPLTDDAREWVETNLVGDDVQWFGGAVVVEPRYAGDIINGIAADGLTTNIGSMA